MRLQAYERMTLFLERINLTKLLMKDWWEQGYEYAQNKSEVMSDNKILI